MLFSGSVRVKIRVRIRISVWLVSGYAHVFVLPLVVTVTLPQWAAHSTRNQQVLGLVLTYRTVEHGPRKPFTHTHASVTKWHNSIPAKMAVTS